MNGTILCRTGNFEFGPATVFYRASCTNLSVPICAPANLKHVRVTLPIRDTVQAFVER